jgi:hypothetical protein
MNTRQVMKMISGTPPHRPSYAMGHATHSTRPEHVALIGECLILWPRVESQMATLLAAIMRAQNDTSIAVYLSLRRNTSRDDAILKAAQFSLDASGIEMLEAILLHSRSLEAERNALSHGHWGMCDQIADGILWASAEDIVLFAIDWKAKLIKDAKKRYSGKEFDEFREKIYVYNKRDLISLRKDISLLVEIIGHFQSYVASYHGDLPHSSGQEVLSQLSACAPIREALRTIRTRAQQKAEKEKCLKQKQSASRSKRRPVET